MVEPKDDPSAYQGLAEKYRPLLVLYPEIEDGSERRDHYHPIGERPGKRPLDEDYHPRDIRFVLDNVWSRAKNGMAPREEVLDAMSENRIDHIDLINTGGPKDVDKFWRVYAIARDKDNNPEYRRRAYARVVRGDRWFQDFLSIQYWMAYFFDDWANVHEMDWEAVTVILKRTESIEQPVACVFNSHIGAFRKPWKDVDRADDAGNRNPAGSHPVAYIANGSHAAYFSDYPPHFSVAEPYLRNALRTALRVSGVAMDFWDYVPRFEEASRCFPEVAVIPEPDGSGRWSGDWRWLNFQGHWGSPVEMSLRERIIARIPLVSRLARYFSKPLREAGPRGPNTRGLCWEDPLLWADLQCLDAPDTSPWISQL
jgi:hypothetical protein